MCVIHNKEGAPFLSTCDIEMLDIATVITPEHIYIYKIILVYNPDGTLKTHRTFGVRLYRPSLLIRETSQTPLCIDTIEGVINICVI
jgi:hypothetical protein